jgi:hypothetical protein
MNEREMMVAFFETEEGQEWMEKVITPLLTSGVLEQQDTKTSAYLRRSSQSQNLEGMEWDMVDSIFDLGPSVDSLNLGENQYLRVKPDWPGSASQTLKRDLISVLVSRIWGGIDDDGFGHAFTRRFLFLRNYLNYDL